MLEFPPNTYMLEYQDGAYLCNGRKRVEAPLNLETLEEAVRQCPKLQIVSLDDALFGDECFPVLARIPKLNMLALLRGRQIAGHGLELLKDLPLKDLFLQRTALDDEGLAQAAQIKKLEHIYIAACHQVTAEGLLAISWRDKLQVSDGDMQDEEGLAELFTEAERKAYEDARTYKIMKNRISLDSPELQAPIHALLEFFDGMNQWERMADQKGDGSQADIDALFARQVSWTPRPGWRPVHLCWERGGTYTGHHLVAGERVTKNKFWLYTEKQISLFNENNKPVFSSVIVVTDRTVLDAQLQETISGFDHKLGAIETIGEDKTSQHLKNAINDGVCIIVTTLQKFPVIYTEIDKANGRYRRSPKRVCGARGISGGRS